MHERDLPQIADIERESFTPTWPQTAYKRELANSMARYFVAAELDAPPRGGGVPHGDGVLHMLGRRFRKRAPGAGEHILGFIGLWLMVNEAHIVTFAVRESHRRLGIGERLLLAAYDCAVEHDQACLTLEVRRSNDSAQRLYEKYSMEHVGLRVRYYTDNNEDAVIMTSPPLSDPAYRLRVERLREAHRARFGDLWE